LPGSDLALLKDCAVEAGRIARSFWREDPQVWDKGGDDPVSEADFAVDTFLRETLLAARPDYGWVSEETEDDDGRLGRDRVFVVDPIDGTRAFVAGQTTWAHSLAVATKGEVTAACVFLPVSERMYLAERGGGATLNDEPIRASATRALENAQVLSPRVTFQDRFWKNGVPDVGRHFRPSLAYRLALVGQGRFDAMLTLRPAWEWDIAAGSLIVSEAGGIATDKRGRPLRFNTPSRQSAGVVASAPGLHGAFMERLA
jgi:myo-inositol-1(or 4)-monophosphatase